MMRCTALVLFALSLTGCEILQNEVEHGYERSGWFNSPATFTTADVRMITERVHPVLGTRVICTEPSPDVAKAVSSSVAVSGQGGNGTITAGLAASGASAEALAELAGRTTALLGLRDGLFRACEAYANGAIGGDAYALVLSRYGQLMTTLFLGQDVTGATFKGAVVQSPGITVNANAPGTNVNPPPPVAAHNGSTVDPAAGADAPPRGANGAVINPATPPAQSEQTPHLPESGPLALTRMNEDYMNLDHNLAHLLAVACINNADPTRFHPAVTTSTGVVGATNGWLTAVCHDLATPGTLDYFVTSAINMQKAGITAPPVSPDSRPAAGAAAIPRQR